MANFMWCVKTVAAQQAAQCFPESDGPEASRLREIAGNLARMGQVVAEGPSGSFPVDFLMEAAKPQLMEARRILRSLRKGGAFTPAQFGAAYRPLSVLLL